MEAGAQGIPLGRYLLGQRLAIGGTGEVYLAVQTSLGRFEKPLALKLLLPHLAEEPRSVRMFLEEAHLAARMNHPNVVQIFDVGMEDGRYFIAMEMVEGVALNTLIRGLKASRREMPPHLLAYVGRALCDGLHHAHEQVGPDGHPLEIVHRDVTPHNVLVSVDGSVKLTDFGIAKTRDSNMQTRPGVIKGKFAYLAPEQVWGSQIDRRADIFGAGVTLFQLATLSSPFRRDSDAATLRAVELEPLPPLSRTDLPRAIADALVRATQKHPSDRYRTAREFRDALPMPDRDPAEELGALVRELCRAPLKELEAKTVVVRSMHTDALSAVTQRPKDQHTHALPAPAAAGTWKAALFTAVALAATCLPFVLAHHAAPPPPLAVVAVAPAAAKPPSDNRPTAVAVADQDEVNADRALISESGWEEPSHPSPPPRQPVRRGPAAGRPRPIRVTKGVAAEPAMGHLTIDAKPWASVYLEGKLIGDTPIAAFPVEPGVLAITLLNPDTRKTVKRRLRVDPGKRIFLRADLR